VTTDRVIVNMKDGLVADVVCMDHAVPCFGYCFPQIKKSIKAEYQGIKLVLKLKKIEERKLKLQLKKNRLCFAFWMIPPHLFRW